MPIAEFDSQEWKRTFSRCLLVGPPNSWKTSSLATWPRPAIIVSYPGEKGTGAIPQGEGIRAFIWRRDEVTQGAVQVVAEIEEFTTQVLAGKFGKIETFAGDGIHKLYSSFLDLVSGGAFTAGKDFEAKLYNQSHERFIAYINRLTESKIPRVVFTCWEGRELDDPDNTSSKAPRHIFPDLPGKMAKRIMGEFGCVLYADPGQMIAPGKMSQGTWQTRPMDKVWGAGMKLPPDIARKIPDKVPQDWQAFEKMVFAR